MGAGAGWHRQVPLPQLTASRVGWAVAGPQDSQCRWESGLPGEAGRGGVDHRWRGPGVGSGLRKLRALQPRESGHRTPGGAVVSEMQVPLAGAHSAGARPQPGAQEGPRVGSA